MNWQKYKVDIPEGQSGNWHIERFEVSEEAASLERLRSAFNPGRRMPVPVGQYTRLMYEAPNRMRTLVMSDTPAEISDHLEPIYRAKGQVLVNGLGLGVVVKAMLEKPEVKSLTVIEFSPDVIALVGDYYVAQYGDRLEIVNADAFTWQPPRGVRYTIVWHDIWNHICSDNLPEMHRLHRKYGRRTDWQGSWCRAECEYQRGFGY